MRRPGPIALSPCSPASSASAGTFDIRAFLGALEFAARKHQGQRRKDADALPYVNHVIGVTHILAIEGGVTDETLLTAAVLHDTVEDTETTFDEIALRFGAAVADLVREATDDKSLEKAERKRLQILHARSASPRAKQLKIADKIDNIRAIIATPPAQWSRERKLEYLTWAEQVVAGCRGVNAGLDRAFDEILGQGRRALAE
jgi:guanosine-3',5'-bis(diphosphate) 3'-pyrophosphohydrolase